MFNLDQLAAFVSVVDLGSFTAAADKVGLTQPAVSLQVKLLEQRLGVKLIERVGRRAQPSPAGLDLLAHARRIIEVCSIAEEAMTPFREGSVGRVRIGSGGTASIHLLPRAIAVAKKRMPDLEIIVRVGNIDEILRDLEANALDLAVVALPASGRSLEVEPFHEDELLAVAPKGSVMPEGGPDVEFMKAKTLLLYEGGNTRRATNEWFEAGGVNPEPAMEFGSVEAIKELVAAGLGWSILPEMALRRDKSDQLVTSPLKPRLVRQLGIVLRRDKHLTKGLREIIKSLREFPKTELTT
ncbi:MULTISPECIES: LysR family transcriptional regulator [Rhizobium]|uniref:HTH-type transcriptional regulator TtuA n=1 Tax=Rhizobium tropici TaxID=398 RepID=A0A6P1CC30_RHITR|nr:MULTISPECIES: LysR family transcriptional regulator [Rhizobium]AGB71201.1 transcriptional regulator, LysR family [Rhizobium tropici CIAT 899]MBB4245154.1 DNA-binding transcriptional LysR family regulator [Rhizobium tropici]MBB5596563.1 DNA-binding transcriptional LysR family regulator [Rhizobium tropici]MBB6495539.1 DNA-binding transcriptional LysR family regulator [Rhizobium tropici]NEV14699.1 LysR family transcriptional regulator [Rhizobium tropici]